MGSHIWENFPKKKKFFKTFTKLFQELKLIHATFFQEDPEDGTLLSLAGWGVTHNLDLVKPDR